MGSRTACMASPNTNTSSNASLPSSSCLVSSKLNRTKDCAAEVCVQGAQFEPFSNANIGKETISPSPCEVLSKLSLERSRVEEFLARDYPKPVSSVNIANEPLSSSPCQVSSEVNLASNRVAAACVPECQQPLSRPNMYHNAPSSAPFVNEPHMPSPCQVSSEVNLGRHRIAPACVQEYQHPFSWPRIGNDARGLSDSVGTSDSLDYRRTLTSATFGSETNREIPPSPRDISSEINLGRNRVQAGCVPEYQQPHSSTNICNEVQWSSQVHIAPELNLARGRVAPIGVEEPVACDRVNYEFP